MKNKLDNKRKQDLILSRLSRKSREAVLSDPKDQQEISKTVKKIFKRYGEDISALSRT